MKNLVLVAWIAALATPAVGYGSEIGLRLGLETPVYTHYSQNGVSGSFSLGDTFRPSITALLEYYPIGLLGIGLEGRVGFLATGTMPNCVGTNCSYQRTGTSIGPNATLDFSPLPVYGRAAIPIHIEPGDVRMDFRLAGGARFAIFYAELTADFPLAGNNISAFSTQQLGLGAGLWFKF
jgi:hypothetical protein